MIAFIIYNRQIGPTFTKVILTAEQSFSMILNVTIDDKIKAFAKHSDRDNLFYCT